MSGGLRHGVRPGEPPLRGGTTPRRSTPSSRTCQAGRSYRRDPDHGTLVRVAPAARWEACVEPNGLRSPHGAARAEGDGRAPPGRAAGGLRDGHHRRPQDHHAGRLRRLPHPGPLRRHRRLRGRCARPCRCRRGRGRRGRRGQPAGPGRSRLPRRAQVVDAAQGRPRLPGGQRRRVRAGHLQGPPADGARPAPAHRGRPHRGLRPAGLPGVHLPAGRVRPRPGTRPGGAERGLRPRGGRSNIFGSDFSLDVVVHPGAGAYICGEETALLESLEGKRGFPRIKPPFFPAAIGLYGQPTVVNNVETLSNLPWIVTNGGAAFAALGDGRRPGPGCSRSRATCATPASTSSRWSRRPSAT